MHDGVDLGGADDAGEDRVRRVGPHELGALERHPRVLRVEPDDDLDIRPLLERLRDATTPVGAQPGDEDTHAASLPPQPNHTLRRVRSMSYSASCTMRRMRSDSSITRLRE